MATESGVRARMRGLWLLVLALWRLVEASVPGLIAAWRGRLDRSDADRRLARMCERLIADCDAKIEVIGREHVPTSGPLVVMSNHQSLCDIPALFAAVPGTLRMVAKAQLFRVPIVGRAMRIGEFIAVDRGDPSSTLRGLADARRKLAGGVRVWIAPEGTRSKDGALLPFKRGGFVLARRAKAPILPVTVDGTRRILPARGLVVTRGVTVRVTIHPPIHPGGAKDEDDLVERVRRAIASALPAS